MALGEPDRSGRPRPLPVEGSAYDIEIDSLIIGIGQGANPLLTHATKELEVDRRGRIIIEGLTQMTSIPGVFAGGDIVTGAATVILAMGAGKLAAASIDAWLRGVPLVADAEVGEGSEEGRRVAAVADIADHRVRRPRPRLRCETWCGDPPARQPGRLPHPASPRGLRRDKHMLLLVTA